MKTNRITAIHTEERFWFFVAVSCFVVVLTAYMYFLSASVVHVVIRKEIDQEIVALGSEISTLEADYIAAQHAMSQDIAELHGYTIATEKVFIDRTNTSLVMHDNIGG